MVNSNSRRDAPGKLSGSLLVADFVAAFTNLTTAETAKYMAAQSEQDTISTIQAASQGQFGAPGLIPPDHQEALIKSSLDAHIKKVQAEQLTAITQSQLAQMEQDDKQKYRGKKVSVKIFDPSLGSVESYWFNTQTGEYTNSPVKSRTLKGVIDDFSFLKNVIILRPTLMSRWLVPNRQYFAVYIVNPETLSPMVDVTLI